MSQNKMAALVLVLVVLKELIICYDSIYKIARGEACILYCNTNGCVCACIREIGLLSPNEIIFTAKLCLLLLWFHL